MAKTSIKSTFLPPGAPACSPVRIVSANLPNDVFWTRIGFQKSSLYIYTHNSSRHLSNIMTYGYCFPETLAWNRGTVAPNSQDNQLGPSTASASA